MEQAKKQNIDLEKRGIISVEIFLYKGDKDFNYKFTTINKVDDFIAFLENLAKEDGIDLITVFKNDN